MGERPCSGCTKGIRAKLLMIDELFQIRTSKERYGWVDAQNWPIDSLITIDDMVKICCLEDDSHS